MLTTSITAASLNTFKKQLLSASWQEGFCRSFGLLSLWSSRQINTPRVRRQPTHRGAYGHTWKDDYSWMEGRGKAFDKHLDQETHYVRQHLQQWKKLQACLRKELETKEQSQLATFPERWGKFSYRTEQSKARPLPTYLRTDLQGQEQSTKGSIIDLETLADVMNIEWAGNSALVYTQPDAQGRPFRVMKHRLGEQQEKDVCLLQEDNEDCFLALAMTDGAYVTINSSSKTASEVHLLSCANPDQPLKLVQPQRPQAAQQPQLTTLSFPSWALSIQPGANPDHHTRTVRLHVASPVHPQHVYDYHLDTGQLQLLGAEQLHGHDPEQYVCQVQYVKAADGTQVPLTVLHKKGMPLNGSHPALLTVYGAYGISLETGFEPERLVLLDRGWVIALAHVRGGGELGRRWHAAGRSLHKMNSLTDLEACLDHLLQQGYSRKGLVGVQAASAGGLLVGALLNRRPHDLLAAILRVPFVDFLTSMTQPELPLTVHEYGEWGDPADPAVLQQMRELCPYQNIKTAEYPPVLATCSATDPRVPVWGPAKWVAKSRQHQIGPSPILLLSSSDTGHYAHEADLLENSALEYAFLIDAFQKKHHINAK
ncbi:hypothetical protein WJX82_004848 [Trebouxia sp. C0006]